MFLLIYSHFNFYKENVRILWFGLYNTTKITPELHDDLISFSFDKLQIVFKNYSTLIPDRHEDTLLTFIPHLLADSKRLVWHRFHLRMKICLFIFYDTAIT